MTSNLPRAAAAAGAISAASLLSTPAGADVLTSFHMVGRAAIAVQDPSAAMADVDVNGLVGVDDLLYVIEQFGNDCAVSSCQADADGDGSVGIWDILQVIAHFGEVIPEHLDGEADTPLTGTHLCEQSRYADDPVSLGEAGVVNDAWMVNGYAVYASKNMNEDEFLGATEADVRDALESYLEARHDLDPATSNYVILDIEHPYHPKDFGRFLDPSNAWYDLMKFHEVIDAYKLRISVARDLLPNARLGLFGVTTPHPFGNPLLEAQIVRQDGFEAAGAAGLYDELDVVCPVIYQRYGPSDSRHHLLEQYTRMGAESALALQRTDGTSLEVMPLMSLAVFNGGSADHKLPITVEDLATQIAVLEDLGFQDWMIWAGNDTIADTDVLVTDHLHALLAYMEDLASGDM
ncbi:MAG: hypothetical protein QF733_08320 [Phycisphaerales bacterium]|jgi:hypothetical protein|nr:hypothetical protein [Phycisphaerales bacterium]